MIQGALGRQRCRPLTFRKRKVRQAFSRAQALDLHYRCLVGGGETMIEQGDTAGLVRRIRSVIAEWHGRYNDEPAKREYLTREAFVREFAGAMRRLEDGVDRFEEGAPRPQRIPYTNETRAAGGNLRSETTHESFGILEISRTHGEGIRLFGSHLPKHDHIILMRVATGRLIHELGTDRFSPRDKIVEIALSPAQFAEAITTLNHGRGTPCTIQRIGTVPLESVPESEIAEHAKIRDDFAGRIEHATCAVEGARNAVGQLLQEKSITKAGVRPVLKVLEKVAMELRADAPYIIDQFAESADRVVAAAKAEVAAYATHVLHETARSALGAPKHQSPLLTSEIPGELE